MPKGTQGCRTITLPSTVVFILQPFSIITLTAPDSPMSVPQEPSLAADVMLWGHSAGSLLFPLRANLQL